MRVFNRTEKELAIEVGDIVRCEIKNKLYTAKILGIDKQNNAIILQKDGSTRPEAVPLDDVTTHISLDFSRLLHNPEYVPLVHSGSNRPKA
ncbi:hypothetical protein ACKJSM_03380 [Pseudomonas sp. PHC1]|uniref:hypothetical protein n=1 Tax=Pseudomonas sp. PHC1 TaxID=3384759 RepID=UPI00396F7272